MKKLKFLVVILAALLLVPFGVFAEGEEAGGEGADAVSNEVNVYFFHGDTCPHCQEAMAWFESIEEEHGSKFKLNTYEVWHSEENSKLMELVAETRGESAEYIPYIVIGNQSWSGFTEDDKTTILEKINSEYEQKPADRYDVMKYVEAGVKAPKENTTTRDVIIVVVLVAVVGLVSAGLVVARKKTN